MLHAFLAGWDQVSAAGMKVVLRFAYSNAPESAQILLDVAEYNKCVDDYGAALCNAPDEIEVEPDLKRMLAHIDQLGEPIFAHEAILIFQARYGFRVPSKRTWPRRSCRGQSGESRRPLAQGQPGLRQGPGVASKRYLPEHTRYISVEYTLYCSVKKCLDLGLLHYMEK